MKFVIYFVTIVRTSIFFSNFKFFNVFIRIFTQIMNNNKNKLLMTNANLSRMLSRKKNTNFINIINWRNLFNDKNFASKFDFVIIETTNIFATHYEFLIVTYDVNEFVDHLNELNAIRSSFEICFNFFYMQRVAKSFKILINEINFNHIKQLFFDYVLNDRKFRYKMHVLFSIILKTSRVSIHFDENHQKIWFDQIVFSTIKIYIFDNEFNRLLFDSHDINNQIHVREKFQFYSVNHDMNNSKTISQIELQIIWNDIKRRITLYNDFANITLLIVDWNQKHFFRNVNLDITKIAFFDHFDQLYDMFKISKIWIDFDIEYFFFFNNDFRNNRDRDDIILIFNIFCLKNWAKQFHNSNNRKTFVRNIIYFFFDSFDVASFIFILNFRNVFREQNQIFHKFYNLIKNWWFIFVKNVFAFDNFYLKNLYFSIIELKR